MGTKNNPGDFDCYANAEPDEPMFVLLGRDPVAGAVVWLWIWLRLWSGRNQADDPQITEAHRCVTAMFDWRVADGKYGWCVGAHRMFMGFINSAIMIPKPNSDVAEGERPAPKV